LLFGTAPLERQVPIISSLSPDSAAASGLGSTLTANGTNFISASVVKWNGIQRTTTFITSAQVVAAIPPEYIAFPGTFQVTVYDPGVGTSAAKVFTVYTAPMPTPTINSMTPTTAVVGGPGFDLQVYGSNFIPQSIVQWNGGTRFTVFLSSKQLRAAVLSADISSLGAAQVTVVNPGGGTSGATTFVVQGVAPFITALSPPTVQAGGPALTLTIYGTRFTSGAVVRCNAADRSTTFVSKTQLSASILSSDVAGAGTLSITMRNPDGILSNARPLTVFVPSDVKADREGEQIPGVYVLNQNYPNPFNPTTTIRYGLPQESHVSLSVFNTLGQKVSELMNIEQEAGYHEVRFDGSSLVSGVYLHRLQAGGYVAAKELLLLK